MSLYVYYLENVGQCVALSAAVRLAESPEERRLVHARDLRPVVGLVPAAEAGVARLLRVRVANGAPTIAAIYTHQFICVDFFFRRYYICSTHAPDDSL